jgi:hypothetical protein
VFRTTVGTRLLLSGEWSPDLLVSVMAGNSHASAVFRLAAVEANGGEHRTGTGSVAALEALHDGTDVV